MVPLLLAAAEDAERIIKFVGAGAAGTAAPPPTMASLSCWEFLQQGGVRVLD